MVLMWYYQRFPLFTLEYQLFRWWKFVISLYVTKYQLLKRNETNFSITFRNRFISICDAAQNVENEIKHCQNNLNFV